jgi:hypothetical protein
MRIVETVRVATPRQLRADLRADVRRAGCRVVRQRGSHEKYCVRCSGIVPAWLAMTE